MKRFFLIPFLVTTAYAQDEAEPEAPDTVPEAAAEDDGLEGHSFHGQVFNEGPRQAAYLHAAEYPVNFTVEGASPKVQAFFDQGVSFLHGFWYFEAERTFRHIASIDPDQPMAYWGMAMSNVDNPERAARFARVAWLKRGLASPREQLYIDAMARFFEVEGPKEPKRLEEMDEKKKAKEDESRKKRAKSRAQRLVRDYEEIIWEYPNDLDAKAFLVNRMWLNARVGVSTTSRHANEALLQQIFEEKPDHPAHHYRIHLWDAKDSAERVIDAALSSGPSLPGVAHMWHMGGHIFARLGRHSDAAWQQEASARVDHAHMMRDWVLPDQIHNFAHNNEWLTRSLRSHGRVKEAISLARNMVELPRHPAYNTLEKRGGSASYGRRRLLETLEQFELWDELVATSRTMYLEPSEEAGDRADRAYLLAKAHAYREDWDGFDTEVESLEEALVQGKLDRIDAIETVEQDGIDEGKSAKEVHEAMTKVLEEHQRELNQMRDRLEALEALRLACEGDEFKDQLDVLKKRSFDKVHLALMCLEAEENKEAIKLARDAAKGKDDSLRERATLAYVLHQVGEEEEKEEALELFEDLLPITALADPDLPVVERLGDLAEAAGLGEKWRPAYELPSDIDPAARPDLDSLGPRRWMPPAAPAWTAGDGFGEEVALADYKGRPVIVIYFLGFGCVHCVEQLLAFAPEYERFQEAGIEIVAIGTDSIDELMSSQSGRSVEEEYPFPILANPDLDLFRAYRAYDDFEETPLHGTFLVDGRGRVRWLDISYEPFMDPDFLLEESVRLLGLPIEPLEEHVSAPATVSPVREPASVSTHLGER